MRRLSMSAITALALALILTACGEADPEPSETSPSAENSTSPSLEVPSDEASTAAETTEPAPTPTPTPEPSAEPSPEPVEPQPIFEPSMVIATELSKEAKGGQTDAEVVAEGVPFEQLEQVGRECVDHFLGQTKAAFCHVWGSQADYDVSTTILEGYISCWAFHVGVPLNGGDPIVTKGDISYWVDGCPGGVVPPLS